MPIFGAFDKETEERQLKEYPLKEGNYRIYMDHTGRTFQDFSPEEYKKAFVPNPNSDEPEDILLCILKEEIDKAIVKEIRDTFTNGVKNND